MSPNPQDTTDSAACGGNGGRLGGSRCWWGGGATNAGLNFRFFPHARPDVRRARISFRYIHISVIIYYYYYSPPALPVRTIHSRFSLFHRPCSPETNTKTHHCTFFVRFVSNDIYAHIAPTTRYCTAPDEHARSTDSARYGHGEIPRETINRKYNAVTKTFSVCRRAAGVR